MKQWLQQLAYSATPDINECVRQLGAVIPWLYDLKKTQQDPGWHAEGNVHIHTGMVLGELYHLLATEAVFIQGEQRQALVLSAILHDIGKPRCTRKMTIRGQQRLGSPDHEAIGRSYLAFQLMKLPLPFSVIWTVLGLVGEHQMPKMLVVQNMDEGAYIALSRRANMALLYWLERADMQGREGENIQQQLEYLETFRRYCKKFGVWERDYDPPGLDELLVEESEAARIYLRACAIDALQRGRIALPSEAVSRFARYKDLHGHLFLLCGPSGIGKSRYVAQQCEDMAVVSLDNIRENLWGERTCQDNPQRVVHTAQQQLRQFLRENRSVVWDATNLRQDHRRQLYGIAHDLHALITVVIFLAPESAIYCGNASRQYAVPTEVLDRQLKIYQFPRISDAHHVIVVGSEGDVLLRQ